ncbi:MAG: YjcZ family sporulation protein [Anaeroplasmataceae bacterium]
MGQNNCSNQNEYGYALILVLFILLVIIGAAWLV